MAAPMRSLGATVVRTSSSRLSLPAGSITPRQAVAAAALALGERTPKTPKKTPSPWGGAPVTPKTPKSPSPWGGAARSTGPSPAASWSVAPFSPSVSPNTSVGAASQRRVAFSCDTTAASLTTPPVTGSRSSATEEAPPARRLPVLLGGRLGQGQGAGASAADGGTGETPEQERRLAEQTRSAFLARLGRIGSRRAPPPRAS